MWASSVLGILLLAFSVGAVSSFRSISAPESRSMMVDYYSVREEAYSMERGFEETVAGSISDLGEPEQVALACLSLLSWAEREGVEANVFFSGRDMLSLASDVSGLVTADGKILLALILMEHSGPCAVVFSRDKQGCLAVENRGVVRGAGMKESGFVLERNGVRTVIAEGRRFCAGPGLS